MLDPHQSNAVDPPVGIGAVGIGGNERYQVRFSRQAMACNFELTLNAGQFRDAVPQAMAALDLVEDLESQLSVFRETSHVSRINRRAFHEDVVVEPRLFALLQYCQELFQQTKGAFDITSGPLTKVWGFYRRQGKIPSPEELERTMQCVGSDKVFLDAAASTIRFSVQSMEINLGSIGKGFALDRCGERLLSAGFGDFFWHAGRSSMLARGVPGAMTRENGWAVGIEHPLRPGKRLAELRVRDCGVGTSAATNQYFRHQGKRYGHLLDPRTGQPAEGVFLTTVLAPTATQADALATAMYVLGPEVAEEYCRGHKDVAMFMVYGDPVGRPALKTVGFAEGDVTILGPV